MPKWVLMLTVPAGTSVATWPWCVCLALLTSPPRCSAPSKRRVALPTPAPEPACDLLCSGACSGRGGSDRPRSRRSRALLLPRTRAPTRRRGLGSPARDGPTWISGDVPDTQVRARPSSAGLTPLWAHTHERASWGQKWPSSWSQCAELRAAERLLFHGRTRWRGSSWLY